MSHKNLGVLFALVQYPYVTTLSGGFCPGSAIQNAPVVDSPYSLRRCRQLVLLLVNEIDTVEALPVGRYMVRVGMVVPSP